MRAIDRVKLTLKYGASTIAALLGMGAISAAQTVAENVAPSAPTDVLLSQSPGAVFQGVTAFSDFSFTAQKDTRPGVFAKDSVYQPTFGVEAAVSPVVSVLGGITYTHIDRITRLPVGTYVSNGATGFIGATFVLPQNWLFQVSGGYGKSYVDQSRITDGVLAFSRFDQSSRFASATLLGAYYFDDLLVRPFAQALYADTRYEAYTETNGAFNRSFLDTIGRISLGGEVSYPFLFGDVLVAPVVRAAFVYDPNRALGYRDRTATDLQGGFNVLAGRLTGGVRYFTTLGRDDYFAQGGRIFISYQF
ncbi:hypothetical protein ASF36_24710 [Methylobacterium sp. Leaf90]|nr:hypothetical protein ASF36_24710 [Methylobacterium sp. Leaf90]